MNQGDRYVEVILMVGEPIIVMDVTIEEAAEALAFPNEELALDPPPAIS